MKPQTETHLVQLDGIRFFAILFVMIAHWLQWQMHFFAMKHAEFVHGVTLFFVLSGFLITRILIVNKLKYEAAKRSPSGLLKSFYIRRFLRIFPIYYLTLFFLLAINFKNIHEVFIYLVTYTSNIYQSATNNYIGSFNHFWSLAVEEQFYIIWPWVIIFTPLKHLKKVIIGFVFLSVATRFYLFYQMNWAWMAFDYFPLSCFQALAMGGLVAYWTVLKSDMLEKLDKGWLIWSGIAVYTIFMYTRSYHELKAAKVLFDGLLFSAVAGLIILRASKGSFTGISKKILENRFVLYSGKISYGMYIFHLFIPELYYKLSPKIGITATNKYSQFVVFYVLTFVLSHFSWKYFESPINNLKDRFPYFKKDSDG
jgi:peptidoglycan/LPS O-acetylase OafA/YrhL